VPDIYIGIFYNSIFTGISKAYPEYSTPLSIASPTPSPQSIPGTPLLTLSPLATATVSPNPSWYRSNPNTYQNTTVITIDRARTNISLKFPNGSITISNATQTSFDATTDYHQSWVIINNTLPEKANQNLSFAADGVTYANSTADSKGFVSFNYTGAWSKHTFEWKFSLSIYDLNSDGEVNILDLNMIAQNFYQPAASCPVCDVDKDGIISILDLVIVAQHFGEKTG